MEPDEPILDPVVALAHLAAHTEQHPLGHRARDPPAAQPARAREAGGQPRRGERRPADLGLGVGYLEPELRALGVPMAGRGARADEYLAAMRSLWEDEAPAYSGRYVEFEGVDAHPRPVQRPLPVVVGGHSMPRTCAPPGTGTAGTASCWA